MANRLTYSAFFALDSQLEKEFSKVAGKQEEQEVVAVNAYKKLDAAEIEDATKYEYVTDPVLDKWYNRLDKLGIKKGIPVGGAEAEFYKPTEL